MTYSIRFVLRKYKPNSIGHHAIQLCVTKNSVRKRISLKLYVDPAYWDRVNERLIVERNLKGEQQKAANKQRIADNTLLEKYKARAREVINRFEIERVDWTLNQFEDAFLNNSKQERFKPYLENHIKTLKETGHTGNSICYFETLRMLGKYDSKLSQRYFADIDLRYVRKFDEFLQKRGNSGNTRKYYFKALRAILNKAMQEGVAPESTYPFGKGGFSVASLEETTEKRYLPNEYLEKIKNTPSSNPQNEYARQLFLFSYYCYGMAYVDMALLTKSNIKRLQDGDFIVYKRQKIRTQKNVKPITIKIDSHIQSLMNSLNTAYPSVDNYILPIVTCAGYADEELYNHIRYRYSKYRKYLSALAEELGIDFNLTSYVSRHTAAMRLQSQGVAREKISQMLGHSDLETTNVYLDGFAVSEIAEAAKVL